MPSLIDQLGTGVITGDKVAQLFAAAKKHGFAIPALSVNSSSTANCSMEAAAAINSPIILQVSNKSAAFVAGGSINNNDIPQLASIAGAVAMALHVRQMAKFYGIPVVLNSLHCSKELLPWLDGMLEADEEFFEKAGEPLFSSHTLDLSEEEDEENISVCKSYLERMAPMKLWLEMEIGIMGGDDGVEISGEDQKRLYTQPEQIWAVHEALSPITPHFSIAAAFGNIHSSHNPGNVKLKPEILVKHQEFVKEKLGEGADDRPCFFVFRGGSGSSEEDMAIAVKAGVVKMNVDTDMQWAYWEGVKNFYKENEGYLQGQIGNPDGEDKPNKKFYDPRVWIRKAEENMRDRVKTSCEHLGNVGTLGKEV